MRGYSSPRELVMVSESTSKKSDAASLDGQLVGSYDRSVTVDVRDGLFTLTNISTSTDATLSSKK